MSGLLHNRIAVVTGAGSGIGRGIAVELAKLGATVACAVRRLETGEETAALIAADGGKAFAVTCDVGVPKAVAGLIETVTTRCGALDIVVHNASHGLAGQARALADITPEIWDAQAAVALDGAWALAKYGEVHLAKSKHARFILLGSSQTFHGSARNPAYTSQKGALRGFYKALAQEWGPLGITVNLVAPAALSEAAERYFAAHPELLEPTMADFPLGRIGDPQHDIGVAVAGLCTDAFHYVTGQSLCLDGGNYTAL